MKLIKENGMFIFCAGVFIALGVLVFNGWSSEAIRAWGGKPLAEATLGDVFTVGAICALFTHRGTSK